MLWCKMALRGVKTWLIDGRGLYKEIGRTTTSVIEVGDKVALR
jgi:hypothetical protein